MGGKEGDVGSNGGREGGILVRGREQRRELDWERCLWEGVDEGRRGSGGVNREWGREDENSRGMRGRLRRRQNGKEEVEK